MASDSETIPINRSESYKEISFYETYVRPCIAEGVGVFFFVFIGTMAVQDTQGLPLNNSAGGAAVAVALGHGMTIAILVMALGSISGAHVNPVVTLAVFLVGEIKFALAVGYVFSQLLGAIIGAGLTRAVLPDVVYVNFSGGGHNLAAFEKPGEAVLCEIGLTLLLVLTILLVAVDPKTKTNLAPLAIGMAVAVDILAGIFTTGASMNPARSFGPAVAMSVFSTSIWKYHYVYWVGPILGSLTAVIIYKFGLASSDKRLIMKTD